MARKGPAFLGLVAALVSPAIPAHAFERATVAGDPTIELAWPVRHLELRVAQDSSADVDPIALRDAAARSRATWSGAGGCTDVRIEDGGAPLGLSSNLMGGAHDGENVVVFREDGWPEDLGPGTLAITTVVYRRSTGEILDADIDFNAVDHVWSIAPVPPEGTTDVENTMTHEIGHFLGFAHVDDPNATMYAESGFGDVSKRDLAEDDVLAVCTVYPRGGTTPGGEGPRPGLAGGCTVGASPASLAPVVALALLALRRRRALSAAGRGARAARAATTRGA